jgi:hypothetical protein
MILPVETSLKIQNKPGYKVIPLFFQGKTRKQMNKMNISYSSGGCKQKEVVFNTGFLDFVHRPEFYN